MSTRMPPSALPRLQTNKTKLHTPEEQIIYHLVNVSMTFPDIPWHPQRYWIKVLRIRYMCFRTECRFWKAKLTTRLTERFQYPKLDVSLVNTCYKILCMRSKVMKTSSHAKTTWLHVELEEMNRFCDVLDDCFSLLHECERIILISSSGQYASDAGSKS